MRSARPRLALLVLLACPLLAVGSLTGCSTTQEKAARQQARAKRILEAREHRREQRSKSTHGSHRR